MSNTTARAMIEFLKSRLDEDEKAARNAIDPERPGEHWQWARCHGDAVLDVITLDDMPAYLATVDLFPTTSVGPLPAFALHHVEADSPHAMPHIARHDPARVLAEIEAKRRILKLHESWPVLVETPPDLVMGNDLDSMTARVTQHISWITTQEYRNRFGDEPPTTPILQAMVAVWRDHPDYCEEWAS